MVIKMGDLMVALNFFQKIAVTYLFPEIFCGNHHGRNFQAELFFRNSKNFLKFSENFREEKK